jgi:NAD(P)-dependent dehydrogenase (short-subunit alcohol dehydrogenase family)
LTHYYTSAGQLGPTSPFLDNPEAPENKNAESLGTALFNCQSFESWCSHSSVNLASIFFVTTAFLGLLAKGSDDIPGYWTSVINITSISGILKLSQNHVRLMFLLHRLYLIQSYTKFCYNSIKAAASHLTKLLSTEIGLKNIPVRVNAIAPGAYESEMSSIGDNPLPIPAKRAGT